MTILAMTIFEESGIDFPQLNRNPLIPTLSLNQPWVPHLLLSADETPKAKEQGNFFLPDFCGLSTSLKLTGSSESLKMLVDFRSFDRIASYSLSLEGPYLKIGLDN